MGKPQMDGRWWWWWFRCFRARYPWLNGTRPVSSLLFSVHRRGVKGKTNRARGTFKIFQDGRGPGPLARSSTGGPSEFRENLSKGFLGPPKAPIPDPSAFPWAGRKNFLLLSQNPNLEGEVLPRG